VESVDSDSDLDDSVDSLDSDVDDSEESVVCDPDPDDSLDVLEDPVDSLEAVVEDAVEGGVWSCGADPPVNARAAPPLNSPATVTARTATIFFIGLSMIPSRFRYFISGIPPPTRTLLRLSRHA
jgi:hypothetical protein